MVDIYDANTNKWSTAALSYNRSNLDASNVAQRLTVLDVGVVESMVLSDVVSLRMVTQGGRYAVFGSGNIDNTSKLVFDFYDGQTGEWAPSHGLSSTVSKTCMLISPAAARPTRPRPNFVTQATSWATPR